MSRTNLYRFCEISHGGAIEKHIEHYPALPDQYSNYYLVLFDTMYLETDTITHVTDVAHQESFSLNR